MDVINGNKVKEWEKVGAGKDNHTNIILATDSYKVTHWNQYPEDTEVVYSYFEARNGAEYDETVFFGLQYILEEYLEGKVVDQSDIGEAYGVALNHFGDASLFNLEGWEYIVNELDGHLPLRIKAVPEGTPIPNSNVLMTVENTDPKCFWLTNYVESILTHVWYSSTVATKSRDVKKIINEFLNVTADSNESLPFMLQDFGYRGATTHEAAAIGGAGHLVNFKGSDTLPALQLMRDTYKGDIRDIGFSVPATEHSVMTALGEEGEDQVFKNLLDNHPSGILSVVSDSYDITRFLRRAAHNHYDQIIGRDGKVVFRPDSLRHAQDTPEMQMVDLSQILYDYFGGTKNEKGYKVFAPQVGLLWGDGINCDGIEKILEHTTEAGFSADNYVFGMGGGLLQQVNRDTQRFAFKCSAQKRNGEWFDICKNPLDTTKKSKAGRLALRFDDGKNYVTAKLEETVEAADILEDVFLDGEILRKENLSDIRIRAEV